MQSVLSKIWTGVAVSISYDDNHYTMGTSHLVVLYKKKIIVRNFLPKHFPSSLVKGRYNQGVIFFFNSWYDFCP